MEYISQNNRQKPVDDLSEKHETILSEKNQMDPISSSLSELLDEERS